MHSTTERDVQILTEETGGKPVRSRKVTNTGGVIYGGTWHYPDGTQLGVENPIVSYPPLNDPPALYRLLKHYYKLNLEESIFLFETQTENLAYVADRSRLEGEAIPQDYELQKNRLKLFRANLQKAQ